MLGAIGRFINLEGDAEKFDKRREYTIAAPNFSRNKVHNSIPLALQSQFNLFDNEGEI